MLTLYFIHCAITQGQWHDDRWTWDCLHKQAKTWHKDQCRQHTSLPSLSLICHDRILRNLLCLLSHILFLDCATCEATRVHSSATAIHLLVGVSRPWSAAQFYWHINKASISGSQSIAATDASWCSFNLIDCGLNAVTHQTASQVCI